MANNTLDYGFTGLQHLATNRVTTVGVEVVWNAIQESLSLYNGQIDAMVSQFSERTTKFQERRMLPGSGTLQPMDEYGEPLPVRAGAYTDVAYPLQGGGTAWGTNQVAKALMTVQEAYQFTADSMTRDADWVRRHLLAALFDNVAWTYTDTLHGSLTIRPLALASDGVLYPKRFTTAPATDTHHLAQAAAIDDNNNPFDDIYTELMEHPSNSGPVVCYVATSLKASIQALSGFVGVTDTDIALGANADRIASDYSSIKGCGDEVLGKTDNCWIVEWGALPSGYIIAHAKGAGPVLAMREYDDPALQGFYMKTNSPNGLYEKTMMFRYAGFGVMNRVAAVVYYVGNSTYAIPNGYDAPLSV